ncbi:MAG: FAD-dependent monooxygenase [Nitrospira sp.]|nr:FAD-dependent monooxygenase [Nitrospira sp.]
MIYDAIIIGGGPAGSTAGLLLARAGWSVALVEKQRFPRAKVCGEFVSAPSLQLLRELGLDESLVQSAGPEIRSLGLFVDAKKIVTEMPRAQTSGYRWGRAIPREHLDRLLLREVAEAGAEIWQPWSLDEVVKKSDGFCCTIRSKESNEVNRLSSRLVIAAQGSWSRRSPFQLREPAPRPADLFAFKARFRNCDLSPELMPLVMFSGGYGGMVYADQNRTSFSFCIRRDTLEQCRHRWPNRKAAEAAFAYIQQSSEVVSQVCAQASLDGQWYSTGPLRPGVRSCGSHGMFFVGNAAGEAHPIIADGINMAIQSAWILCHCLIGPAPSGRIDQDLEAIGRLYAKHWRKEIGPRIRSGSLFATIAMSASNMWGGLLCEHLPWLLKFGAIFSGKTRTISHPTCPPSRLFVRSD